MSVIKIARIEAGGKRGGEEEKEERGAPKVLVPLSGEVREEEKGEEVYREVVAPVAGGELRAGWRELRPVPLQPSAPQQQPAQPQQPAPQTQQVQQAGVPPSSASVAGAAPVPGPAELSSDERAVGEAFIRYLYTEVWGKWTGGFPPSGGRGFVYKKVSVAGSGVLDCVCYGQDWATGCREVCYCPRSKTLINSIPCGATDASQALVVRRVSDAELGAALGRRIM